MINQKFGARVVLFLGFLALSLSTACGRYGAPEPRQGSRSFSWEKLDINADTACLEFNALVSGGYTNLDTVILELSADIPGNCSNCPFKPTEIYTLDDLSQNYDRQSGNLQFFYCPAEQSPDYRVRIIGTNIYDTARNAISRVQTVSRPH
jgi:hypothetical protein